MNKLMLACILGLYGVSGVFAADVPEKAQTCVACHGQNGVSNNPEWPNLAGQKAGYLADQLKAFRDGKRNNPAMAPFVNKLTDTEISELAAYYAGQEAPTSASGDAALVAAGEHLSAYCKACHGMRGQTINQEWPNLAGQQAAYIEKQLKAYREGERINSRMQAVVHPFGDSEFAALAAYYSALKP